MPTVGPQLPPHLLKRKRSQESDNDENPPPAKILAASAPIGPSAPSAKNPDELSLDDSDDDEFGPSIPAVKAVGPSTPSAIDIAEKTNSRDAEEESDADDYGPPPPTSQSPSKKISGPTLPPSQNTKDETKTKRVLGPSAPPANLAERPSHPANNDSDSSSDDDDYGPAPPPAPGSIAALLLQQQQEAAHAAASSSSSSHQGTASTKPVRDDWMLIPPSERDARRADPSAIKSRKFASGKGATKKEGISAIWTETPEEKRRRLEDEVLGRREAATSQRESSNKTSSSTSSSRQATRDDAEAQDKAARIAAYNERHRGKSLMDVKREKEDREEGKTRKEEDDDPSKRAFDREKDMALGGQVGEAQRRELLRKARGFGDRFAKGSFL